MKSNVGVFRLEIMLKDETFNENYVYTGLLSETKRTDNAYWMPKNVSVRLSPVRTRLVFDRCSV
jgi:hypothetical protein